MVGLRFFTDSAKSALLTYSSFCLKCSKYSILKKGRYCSPLGYKCFAKGYSSISMVMKQCQQNALYITLLEIYQTIGHFSISRMLPLYVSDNAPKLLLTFLSFRCYKLEQSTTRRQGIGIIQGVLCSTL